jgi:hypothetical protein
MMFNYCDSILPQCSIVNGLYDNCFVLTPENIKLPLINKIVGSPVDVVKQENKVKQLFATKNKPKANKPLEEIQNLCGLYLTNNLDDQMIKTFQYPNITAFNKLKLKLKNINNIKATNKVLYSNDIRVSGIANYVADYNGVLSVICLDLHNIIPVDSYYLIATAYAIMWMEHTNEPIEQIVIIKYIPNTIMPLVYVDTIDKYIVTLLKRIKTYYEE